MIKDRYHISFDKSAHTNTHIFDVHCRQRFGIALALPEPILTYTFSSPPKAKDNLMMLTGTAAKIKAASAGQSCLAVKGTPAPQHIRHRLTQPQACREWQLGAEG